LLSTITVPAPHKQPLLPFKRSQACTTTAFLAVCSQPACQKQLYRGTSPGEMPSSLSQGPPTCHTPGLPITAHQAAHYQESRSCHLLAAQALFCSRRVSSHWLQRPPGDLPSEWAAPLTVLACLCLCVRAQSQRVGSSTGPVATPASSWLASSPWFHTSATWSKAQAGNQSLPQYWTGRHGMHSTTCPCRAYSSAWEPCMGVATY
jgi:hypothetical protein